MLGCFWTSIFKFVIVNPASDNACFAISFASMFWLLGKWPYTNSTQSFCVCLWKGSSMIMEVTMLTWWIWTNWARENFSPFDCQTTFLDRLKVLNVHSDEPFYYLSPPPSYFICFVYEATKCYGDNQDQFPLDGHFAAISDGIWDNGAACGWRYRMWCISGPRRLCRNWSIVME